MISIWIPDKGVGKGRPRFSNGRTYTDPRYSRWKSAAVIHLIASKVPKITYPCFVECHFINFLSSDSDNLIGSVLDAMVEAEILSNDSSGYVVGCSGRFYKIRKQRNQPKCVGILVKVSAATVQELEIDIKQFA